MKNTIWTSHCFCGNEVSEYGKKNGYVDYRTLAKSFDAVLANDIMEKTSAANLGYWEIENGDFYYYEDEDGNEISEGEYWALSDEERENCSGEYCNEVFQWFIIDDRGAEILSDYTNEIVFYNSELDLYLWGVCHYGTSWDYVLTDIKIELPENADGE